MAQRVAGVFKDQFVLVLLLIFCSWFKLSASKCRQIWLPKNGSLFLIWISTPLTLYAAFGSDKNIFCAVDDPRLNKIAPVPD